MQGAYPTAYKMQEIVDKEVDDLLKMGVIKRSEAPYASPLVLVKKPDNTYRVCVNFKELNKITVFDPEPMMSPDDIFPKLAGSKIYSSFDFCKGIMASPCKRTRGVKRLHNICVFKGSDEIQSYAFWHGKLRLHI